MFTGLLFYLLNPLMLLFIGVVVYLVVRRRGEGNGITGYEVWMTYFYSVAAISIMVALVGLAYLLYVGLAEAYGSSGGISGDLKLGFTLLGTSSVVCTIHVYGRRAVQNGRQGLETIRRAFLFFMLFVFSVAGLVTFPLAVHAMVDHYFDDSDNDEDGYAAVTMTAPRTIISSGDDVSIQLPPVADLYSAYAYSSDDDVVSRPVPVPEMTAPVESGTITVIESDGEETTVVPVPSVTYPDYSYSPYYGYRDSDGDDEGPSAQLAAALVVLPMWAYYGFRVKRELGQEKGMEVPAV